MLKNLLLLSGFSTFAVIIIIGFNIYHNYSLSTLPQSTQTHVIPITPSFDKKTLNDLKKRTPIKVVIEGKSEIVSDDSKDASSITPTISINPTPSFPTSKMASNSSTPTVVPLNQ